MVTRTLATVPPTVDGLLSLLPSEDEGALRLLDLPPLRLRADFNPRRPRVVRLALHLDGEPSKLLLEARTVDVSGAEPWKLGDRVAVLDARLGRRLSELLRVRTLC